MASPQQSGDLFHPPPRRGRRVVVTGQVGVDKRPYLDALQSLAAENGQPLKVFNVGERMYAEAPDVAPGRILDLPLGRLNLLRRSVFKDILAEAEKHDYLVVNTHAAFRWKHGLFPAFDHDHMLALNADIYVTLVDNLDAVHERLLRDHDVSHTLKDILVWREEEILATEILAQAVRGHGCFYVFSRGVERSTVESLFRMIFKPDVKRVYPSFPMTHVMNMPETLAEIDAFRETLNEHFVTFDPGDMDEKRLLFEAGAAAQQRSSTFTTTANGRSLKLDVAEVVGVTRDIDAQIYARDFKMIDQSDMIVSYVPELPDGKPGLSSGVERELQHAYEATKDVYVVWKPKCAPSPFVTETATRVFRSVDEAMEHFQAAGFIGDYQRTLVKHQQRKPRERGRFG